MKICPTCNAAYEDTENFCKQDGTKLVPKTEAKSGESKCPQCGSVNPSGAKFCNSCGSKIAAIVYKCEKCGIEYKNGEKFCNECGGKVVSDSGEKKVVQKSIAQAKVPKDFVLISGSGKDFYICKYEVTQKFWQSVMGNNPSKFRGDNRPVECVSWYDAVEFCNRLSEKEGLPPCYSGSGENTECDFNANGYRLPTEAEWEYAAKGGENYKYAGSKNIDEVAWYNGNSNSQTHDVGQKKPNGYGLYDMSGNVLEWCFDSYSDGYRYNRGGSWLNVAGSCVVSLSDYGDPGIRYYGLGFRLVRSV